MVGEEREGRYKGIGEARRQEMGATSSQEKSSRVDFVTGEEENEQSVSAS